VALASKKVYLRALPHDVLPTRYSVGALRRAAQMQRFLGELQQISEFLVAGQGKLELLVLSHSDWYHLSSYPYGLPLTKIHKDPESHEITASLLIAAAYPPRLLHRFDDPLLKAAKQGYKPPGEPRELLDLLAGCEWAHALLLANQEQSDEKWRDEMRAVSSFTQALKAAGHDFLLGQFNTWAQVQKAGGDEVPVSEFTYPRCKMPFTKMLYLQGLLGLEVL
jgi:predicted secreted protein